MASGLYGSDGYGDSPFGGGAPDFGVDSALAISSTFVRVRFNDIIDYTFVPLLLASNYTIPGLVVFSVQPETGNSVRLLTSTQSDVSYTVTVGQALSYFGSSLDPELTSATFLGTALHNFYTVATRKNRVRVVFSDIMLNDSNLTSVSKYTLTDLSGNLVGLTGVTLEQTINPVSLVLNTGSDLVDERFYSLRVSPDIKTLSGRSVYPDTSIFQLVSNSNRTSVRISDFSGEVQNGLYGIHNGLVFFSPSLLTAAPNSILQVDGVDVCTLAYDQYLFPVALDPPVFFTHGAGLFPTPNPSLLNSSAALWAPFPRLLEAKFELGVSYQDTASTAVDGPATATLTETLDPNFVSLLNSTGWKLFDNAGTPPLYFATANNLAPIPPGSSVVIPLEP